MSRDRQWTDLQGESREGVNLGGGLAGQSKTLHRKKLHFLRIEGDEYIISPDPPTHALAPAPTPTPASDPDQPIGPKPMGSQPMGPQPRKPMPIGPQPRELQPR